MTRLLCATCEITPLDVVGYLMICPKCLTEEATLTKIKFNLGYGEFINCWAAVIKRLDGQGYSLFFDDCLNYTLHAKFNHEGRYFQEVK
jgi:hypothetical protein